MKKIVIIGNRENDRPLSGPANVALALCNGLSEKGIKYSFINSYAKTPLKKAILFTRLVFLAFKRNSIINVHTFGYKSAEIIMKISRINKSNRYFLTLNGLLSKEIELSTDRKFDNNEERPEYGLIKGFPEIICVSELLRKKLENEYGRQEGLYVVETGLSNANASYSFAGNHDILMAGGICPEKGTMEALEIFADIHEKLWPDSRMTIVGVVTDEDYNRKILNYISENGLDGYVDIIGRIEKKKLAELYGRSSFIIASSRIDTFNLTVLEAMNFGCVPIVSEECGVKALITPSSGIVYSEKEKVWEMLKSLDVQRASTESYEISSHQTPEKMADGYLNTFYGE